MKEWIKNLEKKSFGSGTYSQSYQDELLDIIFFNVKPKNKRPYCVEFGFNSKDLLSGTGANVSSLILKHKWNSLLLDGKYENPKINLHKHFLTTQNISSLFNSYNVPKEPEYISIDVDSTDLWLFKSIVQDYRAMLFSVEYNANFPIEAAITFPNNSKEYWEGDRGYGASLKALNMVAIKHGYSLLWVVPFLDAFFIRNDLIDDGTKKICFPIEKWKQITSYPCHPPLKNESRLSIFINYETYINTNGDVEKSKKEAYDICKKYLTVNGFFDGLKLKVHKVIVKTILLLNIKHWVPKSLIDILKKLYKKLFFK